MKKLFIWTSGLLAGALLYGHIKEAVKAPVDDYTGLFLGLFMLASYTMDILTLRER